MLPTFISIDVETANPDLASICQIGIATFTNGQLTDTYKTYIDPQQTFDSLSVKIHGIDENTVRGAPQYPDVHKHLQQTLNEHIVIHHTAFDRLSLNQNADRYQLTPLTCTWLDTARVARRAWEQFRHRGYGLANLAQHCNIQFNHHDALEDARAAGEILLRVIAETNITLEEWTHKAYQRINNKQKHAQIGDPDGPLYGESVTFTGKISITRSEAAALAARAGCDVADNDTKKTTLLVVGDQDIQQLAGHQKSRKHRKAEQYIANGQPIRIITQSDFTTLIDLS